MKKNKTIRTIVLNYVKANGPATWTELHHVVLTVAGQNLNRNEYGSCYLDRVSYGVSACLPTDEDSRYLVKSHVDGKYHLVNE